MLFWWEETGVLGENPLSNPVTTNHLICRRRVSNEGRSCEGPDGLLLSQSDIMFKIYSSLTAKQCGTCGKDDIVEDTAKSLFQRQNFLFSLHLQVAKSELCAVFVTW